MKYFEKYQIPNILVTQVEQGVTVCNRVVPHCFLLADYLVRCIAPHTQHIKSVTDAGCSERSSSRRKSVSNGQLLQTRLRAGTHISLASP